MVPGTRSKFGVWRPNVRTWGLSEANVLYWRKYLWHCCFFSAPHAVISRPHVDSATGELFSLSPSLRPCIHELQSCINTAPLPKALSRVCYASITEQYDKTVALWHAITRGSDIVTEQECSLAMSTSPRPSHAIRKDKSVRTAAFQARKYYSESGWDEFKSMAVRIWLLCKELLLRSYRFTNYLNYCSPFPLYETSSMTTSVQSIDWIQYLSPETKVENIS